MKSGVCWMLTPETELAYKLIGSLIYGGADTRQRIMQAVQDTDFQDETVQKTFRTLYKTCRDFPQADDTVLLKTLDRPSMEAIVLAWQEMPKVEVSEKRLDDTLSAFRWFKNQQRLKAEAAALTFAEEIHTADCQRLAQLSEQMQDTSVSAAERYLAAYDEEVPVMATGFPTLDTMLNGGFAAGTVATVGARPSVGKTTFSLNIAAAHPQEKVLFFSIEMTARMIYDRLIADKANVPYPAAIHHKMPKATAKAVLDSYPLLVLVDDVSAVETITDRIYSEKPRLVVIDFIQIVTSDKRFVDNRQRIDYISQRLKQAAKATGCCILVLSQLTRAGKDRPTMSDLKESGGLEQDSDYVLLIHRPYVQDKTSGEHQANETTVICDKNKFGNTGEWQFDFDGLHQRFTPCDDKPIARPKSSGSGTSAVDGDIPF